MHDTKKPDLAMNFSRTEGGLVVRLNGATIDEAGYLARAISPDFQAFLHDHGYDLSTLRFSIRKRKVAP